MFHTTQTKKSSCSENIFKEVLKVSHGKSSLTKDLETLLSSSISDLSSVLFFFLRKNSVNFVSVY